MEKFFAATCTESLVREAVASGKLLESNRKLYVSDTKVADKTLYGNYFLKEVRNNGAGRYNLIMQVQKAVLGDQKYTYNTEEVIDFPVVRRAAGEFVFTNFPYWDKAR